MRKGKATEGLVQYCRCVFRAHLVGKQSQTEPSKSITQKACDLGEI